MFESESSLFLTKLLPVFLYPVGAAIALLLFAAMASGQDVELSDVMLSLETESLAMSLVTSVRNKAVEAYQDVFRMQI